MHMGTALPTGRIVMQNLSATHVLKVLRALGKDGGAGAGDEICNINEFHDDVRWDIICIPQQCSRGELLDWIHVLAIQFSPVCWNLMQPNVLGTEFNRGIQHMSFCARACCDGERIEYIFASAPSGYVPAGCIAGGERRNEKEALNLGPALQ
ncbi:hypothetical protein C8R44DRAFT_746117 [Mycena epipterygia]|nr:hypothetical protein C8R44DRAFT_746117 [Mycena epipterygia]